MALQIKNASLAFRIASLFELISSRGISSTFKALFIADFAEINERANSTDYPELIMHVLSSKLNNIWLRCGCSAQVIKNLQVCTQGTHTSGESACLFEI